MPGPGTGPRPGGWETLPYRVSAESALRDVYWKRCGSSCSQWWNTYYFLNSPHRVPWVAANLTGDHTASVFLTLPHFQKPSERLTSHQGGRNTRLNNSFSRTPKLELARQRNLRQFKEKDEKEGNEGAARVWGEEVGYIYYSPHTVLYYTQSKLADCRIHKSKEPTRSSETCEIRVTSATWLWDVTRLGRAKRVVRGWRSNTDQKKQRGLARGQIFMLASRFWRISHSGGQGSIPGHSIGGAWCTKLGLLRVLPFPRVNSYTTKLNIHNNEYQWYQVVRSNTTLLFSRCQQTDYMFRPFFYKAIFRSGKGDQWG